VCRDNLAGFVQGMHKVDEVQVDGKFFMNQVQKRTNHRPARHENQQAAAGLRTID